MPKRIRDLPAEYLIKQQTIAQAIGARVRLRRGRLALTQEQLRARLELEHVHVSRAQYSRIENGDSELSTVELFALRTVLDVSWDWLMEGKGPEP